MKLFSKNTNNRSLPHSSWHRIGHDSRADWIFILLIALASSMIFGVFGIIKYLEVNDSIDTKSDIINKKSNISESKFADFFEYSDIKSNNRSDISEDDARVINDPSL